MRSVMIQHNNRRWCGYSLVLFALFALIGLMTIRDYGMGWDEVTRWNSGDLKLEYYQDLLQADEPASVFGRASGDRYPGLFDMTLALAHRVIGVDRFMLGHYWSASFGLFALLCVWLCGYRLGGVRLGFWSALFLLLIPSFYGHLFHNPKDIPFAAMYMCGILALVMWAQLPERPRISDFLLLGLAIGFALSVRIAAAVLFAYFGLIVCLSLLRAWQARIRAKGQLSTTESILEPYELLRRNAIGGLVVVVVAFSILMFWWPAGHRNVFAASEVTLQQLHHSASSIPLFFRGEWLDAADAPFYYTLWMFVIKSPESLLLLLGLGAGVLIQWTRSNCKDVIHKMNLPLLVVLLGGVFPLAYLTYAAPALHNGARHFLFIYPPLCILAALAYLRIQDALLQAGRKSLLLLWRVLIPGMLLLQVLQLLALHPYQYVYYNALIGGPAGSYGKYETEYWFTSTKHGLEALDEYLDEAHISRPVSVFVVGPRQVAEHFLPEGIQMADRPEQAQYVIANTQMMMHHAVEGTEVLCIERSGLPILYIYRAANESVGQLEQSQK